MSGSRRGAITGGIVALVALVVLAGVVFSVPGVATAVDGPTPTSGTNGRTGKVVDVTQYSSPAAISADAANLTSPWDPQQISAPGGPALVDSYGRVVTLHGVNAVYKRAPYELTVKPGMPWSFTASDAARIAQLGFDVVRLGILWEGLEPGTGGPNNPAVCTPGTPRDPDMFSSARAQTYLAQVVQLVDLLGSYDVHTILDMHQDLYSQVFSGEGAPPWAVCTNGLPITILPGRWSRNYADPALDIAANHFFANDVIGDLQGEFDHVWGLVASTFAQNPWVVGYDPYNEPFSLPLDDTGSAKEADVAAALECFYTGRADPGWTTSGTRLRCPATDPAVGVVPTIEAADPTHLVFVEPDLFTEHGAPDLMGPMPFGRLVLNFHAYCGHRNPVTGDPTNLQLCALRVIAQMQARQAERPRLATSQQPGGPAWIMSEFGATRSTALLDMVTSQATRMGLSWAYWSWKFYDDPTGSTHEGIVESDGALGPQAAALAQPYAEAVAGRAISAAFDTSTDTYELQYRPDPSIAAPTVVVTASLQRYPAGYCTAVAGGSIDSVPGAQRLIVWNAQGAAETSVQITPGACSDSQVPGAASQALSRHLGARSTTGA